MDRLNSEKFITFYFQQIIRLHDKVTFCDFSVNINIPKILTKYDFHDFFSRKSYLG